MKQNYKKTTFHLFPIRCVYETHVQGVIPDRDTGKRRCYRSGLIILLSLFVLLPARSQKIEIYPEDMDVNLSGCTATAVKTFTVENTGTEDLTYSFFGELIVSSDAGDKLDDLGSLSYGSRGIVTVGEYLYSVNYSEETIEKYDLEKQTIISSFSVESQPYSIAYCDGYLWVTQYNSSTVYCYDTTGNAIDRTITSPVTSPLITSDGNTFYIAPFNSSLTTIYNIDVDGNVIDSYDSEVNYLYALTWSNASSGGELWGLNYGYYYYQLSLWNNTARKIFYFYYYNTTYSYAFVHNGKDFYSLNYNGDLSLIDDGVKESAVVILSEDDTLASGDQGDVEISFDASDLMVGTYYPYISVMSNDEVSTPDINVYLTVTGEAQIDLSTSAIDFGTIICSQVDSASFWISNPGCNDLVIDTIEGATSEILLDASKKTISGKDSLEVMVYFSPQITGAYSTTLTLVNIVEEQTVVIVGTGLNNPTMDVDTDTIEVTISSCTGTSVQTFNISNTNSLESSLEYHLQARGEKKLADLLVDLDGSYTYVTDLIPYAYNFSMDGGSNYIADGGYDMYDYSNYLSTNFASQFDYSDGVIVEGGAMGTNGSYFTRKYDDLFVLAADLDSVSYFNIYGDLGSDGGGSFDADTIEVGRYMGFITRNYNAYDPSINHLIIVEKNSSLYQTYDEGTSIEDHTVYGLSESVRLYYLLFAGTNGGYITTDEIEEIMKEFLSIVGSGDWMNVTPSEGIVGSEESSTINLTIDASELAEGEYEGQVYISSNDTINSVDTVQILLTIEGEPVLTVVSSTINLPYTYPNVEGSDSLWIYNTGCDTLEVDSIKITGSFFTLVTSDEITIDPYDSAMVTISWNSPSAGDIESTMSIYSNAEDVMISLSVSIIEPPALSISTDTFEFDVSCNDTVTVSFTVNNSGGDTLDYNVITTNKMLVLTYGVDYYQEYSNLIEALNLYNTNYSITESDAYTSAALSAALTDINTILIPEQENGSSTFFSNISSALQDFVSNGGNVIICGDYYGYSLYSGLYSGSIYSTSNGTEATVNDYSHLLTSGLSDNVITTNGCYTINFTSDMTSLIDYNEGSVFAYGYYRRGKIVYIAYDYYLYNDDGARMIANAVSWTTSSSSQSYEGEVIAGASETIDYALDVSGCPLGESSLLLFVTSNDPVNQVDTVVCLINKTGEPAISLSTSSSSFEDVLVGSTVIDTVWVRNYGCDTLKVTDISGETSQITVSSTSFNILPSDSVELVISFGPDAPGDYSTTLTMVNNDVDVTISVDGTGMNNPGMTVSIDTLSTIITGCGSAYTFADFTIADTVANSTLSYSFISDYDSVSKQYYSTTGETTNHIFNNVPSGNEITLIITLNGDYTSYTNEYAMLVIEGTTIGQVNTENITDGVDYERTYTFEGSQVSSWLADGTLEVYLVNSSAVNTGYGEQLNQVELILEGIPAILSLSSESGTIEGKGSVSITPTVVTEGMESGLYTGNLYVYSNDTANGVDTIYYSITIIGAPEMSLSAGTINFPEININQYTYSKIIIENTGCDTLEITNITSDNSVFTTDASSFTILPFSSDELNIYFESIIPGDYSGTISIENNDVDAGIMVYGSSANTKVKSVISYTDDGYYGANDTIDISLRFNQLVYVNTSYGIPTIAFNSGDTATAYYIGGSGSSELSFEYIIAEDENSAALDYNDSLSFFFNGAILQDYYSYSVDSILPSVGSFSQNYSIVIDNVNPSVTLTTTEESPTYNSNLEVIVTFSESVTFDTNNITIVNGTLSGISTEDNIVWTAIIVAQDAGEVSISISEEAAYDVAGNLSTSSNTLVITYVIDNESPSVILTTTEDIPTSNSNMEVTVTFSESVTFETNNITIDNGTLASISTEDNIVWTALVAAQDTGEVTISVPEGAAYDAAGNLSTASNTLVLVYATAGSGAISLDENTISLYPNPSTDKLYIDLGSKEEIATIEIYTINSVKIKTIENYTSNSSINVSDLISGTYILQIKTTGNNVVKQLLKE